MSAAVEIGPITRYSYQRLRNDGGFHDDVEEEEEDLIFVSKSTRARSWCRINRRVGSSRSRKFRLRIPGLRRFLRKKSRLVSSVRVSLRKAIRRFKESKPYLADLFAGNYLFLQISPTPIKYKLKSAAAHDFHGVSARYPLER